jgi:two-component system chemotaxis response regulator CheB
MSSHPSPSERTQHPIRVLISEDSPTSRDLLVHIFSSDPDMRVVGTAGDGEEALEAVRRCRPDLVMMDVHMPKMDGFEATRRIMTTTPVPIVIISETLVDQVAAMFRASEAGALAFTRHPPHVNHPEYAAAAADLLQLARLMAEVRVVRRWSKPGEAKPPGRIAMPAPGVRPADIGIIAIGASTGGPIVLQGILTALAPVLRVPVVVTQHMAEGFIEGFAEWLGQTCGLHVHVATGGEPMLPGHVYLAPEQRHLALQGRGRIRLVQGPAEHGQCPSISFMFRSVAEAYGPDSAGVLLTGMGRDGADGLKVMKESGAVTCAQDEASSVVHGMPGEAVRLDAASHVLEPEAIAALLAKLIEARGRTP